MSRRIIPAIALLALSASPASADAIDGQWCHEGSSLQIDGPSIRTPGGARISGDYSRHAFAYVAPDGEAGEGGMVEMRLLGDDDMDLRKVPLGGEPSVWERWRRCQVTS
jgi:hypothetical protein